MYNHDFDFDPSHGRSQEDLLAITPPEAPEGFDVFWRETYEGNSRIPVKLERRKVESPSADYDLSEVTFDTWDGYRVGAWLTTPKDGAPTCGFVEGHGYSGREEAEFDPLVPGAAVIFPCAQGFGLSRTENVPDLAANHVLHEIHDRERYIIRGCVAGIWSAATALLELFPAVEERLYFTGSSFGGGLGGLALPWDSRFRRGYLKVPTFGHHPLRLASPSVGSAESVRNHYVDHPEIMEILRYYDAATSAARIQIPVLGAPALFDPAVPPPGQFAVTNALKGESEIRILPAGHFEWEGQLEDDAKLRRQLEEWFGELV